MDALKRILSKETAVLIYFYNDDCPPCISLRPKVENLLEQEFPKINRVWINSKATPEIPANYSVFANPTLLVFFDGKETRRFSKYVSLPELRASIDRYYRLVFGEPYEGSEPS
jgi:thiol-disulfide isomerase/thioredoxin